MAEVTTPGREDLDNLINNPSDRQSSPRLPNTPQTPDQGGEEVKSGYKHALANDEEKKALLTLLWEVNGSESYNPSTVAVAGAFRGAHIVIPNDVRQMYAHEEAVGNPRVSLSPGIGDIAAVYYANQSVAPKGIDAKLFGLMRMEAWKIGWVGDDSQVSVCDPVDANLAMESFLEALKAHKDRLASVKLAAWIVPLCSEFVFRTQGHHYLSGNATEFQEKYGRILSACLVPEIANLAPAEVLYHAAFHWIGPARIRSVVLAQSGTVAIPDAIKIRINAAPAGSAIICSTVKVLEAMGSLRQELEDASGVKTKGIFDLDAKIRDDPTRYHKAYFVYGAHALNDGELKTYDVEASKCKQLAPALEGFIRAYFRQGDLGQVKVFAKHASANPVRTKKCANYYKGKSQDVGDSLGEIFGKIIPEPAVVVPAPE